MSKDSLGKMGRDVITGFEGRIIGYVQYLTGCNQYLLVPGVNKKGDKREDGEWFDDSRVEITGERIVLPGVAAPASQPSRGPDIAPPLR